MLAAPGITGVSMAGSHPRVGAGNARIFLTYLQGGRAHVATAATKVRMSAHMWSDTGFSAPASAVSIALDGTMPKDTAGRVEFKSGETPWVFWVDGGRLYTRTLDGGSPVTLAEGNCTGVSAVRAMWSSAADAASAFTVTAQEYAYVTDGPLETVVKAVARVENKAGYADQVDLANGMLTDVAVARGLLRLAVDNG